MDVNSSQAPMAAATVSAVKKAFRKVVKEALKGLEGENVGLQCKQVQVSQV